MRPALRGAALRRGDDGGRGDDRRRPSPRRRTSALDRPACRAASGGTPGDSIPWPLVIGGIGPADFCCSAPADRAATGRRRGRRLPGRPDPGQHDESRIVGAVAAAADSAATIPATAVRRLRRRRFRRRRRFQRLVRRYGKATDATGGETRKAYGERLVSVVLYGSAAAGDHHARLLRLSTSCACSPDHARANWPRAKISSAGGASRAARPRCCSASTNSPPPPTASPSSSATSSASHRILFGSDVIASLVLDDVFYRAQVEHDLRAKLLRAAAEGRRHALRPRPAAPPAGRFGLHLLRAASGTRWCCTAWTPPATEARHRRARAARRFGIDAAPFESCSTCAKNASSRATWTRCRCWRTYLKEIANVIDAVDRLEK